MIIYFSGEGSKGNPEIVLQDKANIMLTFYDVKDRMVARYDKVIKARRKAWNKKIKKLASKIQSKP